MAKKQIGLKLQTRTGRALLGLLALVATYVVAIRAIDTGSLWQYGLTLTLLIIGVNRLVSAIHKR